MKCKFEMIERVFSMLHKSKQYLTFCISQQMFSHIIHILSSFRIKTTAEWKQEHVLCKGNTALTLFLSIAFENGKEL